MLKLYSFNYTRKPTLKSYTLKPSSTRLILAYGIALPPFVLLFLLAFPFCGSAPCVLAVCEHPANTASLRLSFNSKIAQVKKLCQFTSLGLSQFLKSAFAIFYIVLIEKRKAQKKGETR
jgi:hypothetical protein